MTLLAIAFYLGLVVAIATGALLVARPVLAHYRHERCLASIARLELALGIGELATPPAHEPPRMAYQTFAPLESPPAGGQLLTAAQAIDLTRRGMLSTEELRYFLQTIGYDYRVSSEGGTLDGGSSVAEQVEAHRREARRLTEYATGQSERERGIFRRRF